MRPVPPEYGANADPIRRATAAPNGGAYVGVKRPHEAVDQPPLPGQMAVVMAGLSIGLLLMGIQLWLLTIALELFLSGEYGHLWQLSLASGVIFAGGLLIIWLLRRRPIRRLS
jgi:hypothetical protein